MRILHIMGGADAGGVAMVVYNYMRYIDQQQFHFDFALTGHQPGMLGRKMIDLGARFYPLPLKSNGIEAFERALIDLLRNEHFDVIHVHGNSTSYIALRIAKKCGIAVRIAHAHTAGKPKGIKNWLTVYSGRILNRYYSTHLIACGQKAGELVFGVDAMDNKKVRILPNAVEPELFRYNPTVREQIRDELKIKNRYVIGMVGRLSHEKNHMFIMPVIKKIHEQFADIVFVIVGQGELEKELKDYCNDNNMNDYVLFCGVRSDISRYYQGFDVCVLPSLYEGFPVVGLEAIDAGLPLLLSSNITPELGFSRLVKYLPLDEKQWFKALVARPQNSNRAIGETEIKENHFNISDSANLLKSIYEEAYV